MKTFYAPLSELAGIEQLKKNFEVTGQPVMISGCHRYPENSSCSCCRK